MGVLNKQFKARSLLHSTVTVAKTLRSQQWQLLSQLLLSKPCWPQTSVCPAWRVTCLLLKTDKRYEIYQLATTSVRCPMFFRPAHHLTFDKHCWMLAHLAEFALTLVGWANTSATLHFLSLVSIQYKYCNCCRSVKPFNEAIYKRVLTSASVASSMKEWRLFISVSMPAMKYSTKQDEQYSVPPSPTQLVRLLTKLDF